MIENYFKNWPTQPLNKLLILNQSGIWGDEGTESDYPVLRSTNIHEGKLLLDGVAYRKIDLKEAQKYLLEDGDIIVTKSSGSAQLIGKCCVFIKNNNKKYLFSNFTQRLRVNKNVIDPYFLFYYLTSPLGKAVLTRINNTTSGLRNLNMKDYSQQAIPTPPLPIQRNIVSVLDKCESARIRRKEANSLTDEFLKSVFLDMFGDPVKNPKKWEIKKGNQLFMFSSGKFNPSKNLNDSYPYPSYGGNGIMGYSDKYLIDYDTLVIGRVGAYCGCIHRTKGKVWITDNAIFIKKFKENINLDFLFYLFEFHKVNRFADYSGQPKITQYPLENLNVMLPPKTQQEKFAKIVQKAKKLKEKQRKSEEELNYLFNLLMQKAFRGELA